MRPHEEPAGGGEPANPAPRRFRWLRWVLGIFSVLVLLIGLAVAGVVYMLRSEPPERAEQVAVLDQTPPERLASIADAAEGRLVSRLNGQPPPPPSPDAPPPAEPAEPGQRTVELTEQEVNAWLRVRLPRWMDHQGMQMPSQMSDPLVATEPGRVLLSARLNRNGREQTVTAEWTLRLEDDGQLWVRLIGLRAGRLPLPVKALVSSLEGMSDDQQAKVQRLLALIEGERIEPVFTAPGGNERLRLVGLDIGAEGLRMRVVPAE